MDKSGFIGDEEDLVKLSLLLWSSNWEGDFRSECSLRDLARPSSGLSDSDPRSGLLSRDVVISEPSGASVASRRLWKLSLETSPPSSSSSSSSKSSSSSTRMMRSLKRLLFCIVWSWPVEINYNCINFYRILMHMK